MEKHTFGGRVLVGYLFLFKKKKTLFILKSRKYPTSTRAPNCCFTKLRLHVGLGPGYLSQKTPKSAPAWLPRGSCVAPAWFPRGSRVAATLPRGSRVGPAWLPCGSRVAFVWPRGSHHEGTYLGIRRHVARECERTLSSSLRPHPRSAPPMVTIAQRREGLHMDV